MIFVDLLQLVWRSLYGRFDPSFHVMDLRDFNGLEGFQQIEAAF